MVSVAAFDELGNEEEDDEVISLHIGSDELFITPLSLVLRRYFQNMGEFILFILEILKTNKPFFLCDEWFPCSLVLFLVHIYVTRCRVQSGPSGAQGTTSGKVEGAGRGLC